MLYCPCNVNQIPGLGDRGFGSLSLAHPFHTTRQVGSAAQFKGEGTLNGEGSYSFRIWANDGATDTFRIQIWGDNGTVYDNGAQQSLGGGSIVIHTRK